MGRALVGRRWHASALAAFWAFFSAHSAQAQAGTGTGVALSALVTHSIERSDSRLSSQLSYRDCVDDDILTFALTLSNRGTNTLEVWAGAACEVDSVRTSTTQTQCWLLHREPLTGAPPHVVIPVRSLLAGYTSLFAAVTDPTQPNAIAGTLVQAGVEACVPPDDALDYDVTPATLYFMLTDGTESLVGTFATWAAQFKLVGPPPPDDVRAAIAARRLVVSFDYRSPPLDTTIDGYRFYCDPPPGEAASAVAADAGARTCGSGPSSTVLVPGSASVAAAYFCGSAGAAATRGDATPLDDGVPYQVAVAATDTFDNMGPLSAVACNVPRVDDRTVSACSFTPLRAPAGGVLPLLAIPLLVWPLARRRGRTRGSAGCARRRAARSW